MDLRDTTEDAQFRKELRYWLETNVPADWWHSQFEVRSEVRTAFRREWQQTMFRAGWVGIAWPQEFGGRGAGLVQQAIFSQEMARAQAPRWINNIGVGMVGPTIIVHGTQAQKQRYLSNILSADEIWCQGYSEPGAGSDLAGLQTSAIREGDVFIINGQKVWTTLAHVSDWCMMLVRTDSSVPKHQGLTCFIVDMRSPGIDVRPLRQITGDAEFNEVFFTDVRVCSENMLGGLNDGWRVATTTLMHERESVGSGMAVGARIALDNLISLAKRSTRGGRPANEDPVIRQELAQLHIEVEAARLSSERAIASIAKTGVPGPESSIIKLTTSETMQRMTGLAIDILGPAVLAADSDLPGEHRWWRYQYLNTQANTIAGGTSDVMRNILGERVLGLPR